MSAARGPIELEMDLRLIYEGPLPTERSRVVQAKHDIRVALRYQLLDHVRRRPALSHFTAMIRGLTTPQVPPEDSITPDFSAIGRKFKLRGQEFVPLIVGAAHAICHLEILFLRREESESLISKPKDVYGGDLDNRIKIFLDALRAPQEEKEIPDAFQADEEPFFCLLEDDSLITKVSIEADVLPGLYLRDQRKEVQINLRASLRLTYMTYYNLLLATAT
jgi:hypothetical protein